MTADGCCDWRELARYTWRSISSFRDKYKKTKDLEKKKTISIKINRQIDKSCLSFYK